MSTTKEQLDRFLRVTDRIRPSGHAPPLLHAANTAGTILHPDARLDMVRTGIGIYGIEPAPGVGAGLGLRPALTWRSEVTAVKRLAAGEAISYGHRYRLERDAWIATVPVGYADGYPRTLSSRADVLIGGRRCRVAGNVTMDQLMADCGDREPRPGDEVLLVGSQGEESVTANELGEPRVRSDTRSSPGSARVSRVVRSEDARDPETAAVIGAGIAAGALAAGAVGRTLVRRRVEHDLEAHRWDLPPEDLGDFESFDGTRIAVRAAGDAAAPVLLFVHGFSLDMTTWHEQWVDLSTDFRCVLMDQRGHGRSGAPAHGNLSLGRWAATSARCSTSWRLTGLPWSWATAWEAWRAIALAEQRPELFGPRIAGLILVGSSSTDLIRGAMGSLTDLLRPRLGSFGTAARRADRLRRAVLASPGDLAAPPRCA